MGVRRGHSAIAVLALVASGSVWADSPAGAPELTLAEAIRLAMQNNHGVCVAALEVQRAEDRVAAARAHRLPSLDFQATAGTTLAPVRVSFPGGAFGTYPVIGPIPATDTIVEAPRGVSGNVTASATQPLTQLHRIGLSTKLNELGRDVERAKLQEERMATATEVRRLYYQLLQAESALKAKEEEVSVYRELDRVVQQQVAAEVALPSDGLDVKARLAGEEYDLASIRGDLATGRQRMNLYLGRALETDFALVAVPETSLEEADLSAALARAMDHRPDLAQARLAVEQADVDRRLKRAESIPDVSLAVTYTSFVNVDLLPRNVAMAGLQIKWEPFDWGRKGKERAEKEIQVEQARSTARDAADRVRIDVADRFRKLHEARLLIEAERLGRDAAREKLRVVTSRHGQDAALLKDLLEAQASLSGAAAQYDRALMTFWTAKADFEKAIGEEL